MSRFVVRLGIVSASLLFGLGLAEGCVRYLGLGPWPRARLPRHEPVFHLADPVLGWRNKPGTYDYPGYTPASPEIHMTIAADGSRATGGDTHVAGREILLVGCSFAFGQGLSDEDSLGWRLQRHLPGATVRNLAVAGYGTLQSLVLLEERVRDTRSPPIVVYAFIDGHDSRNIAHPEWLRLLTAFSRAGMVAVPFATLDPSGHLVRHPPLLYPLWPLRRRFGLVSFLQDRTADLTAWGRVGQATAVTEQLVADMNTEVANAGGKLLVAVLYGPRATMQSYERSLSERGIDTADCSSDFPIPESLQIAGEGHPNGLVNERWAACIADNLHRELPELAPPD